MATYNQNIAYVEFYGEDTTQTVQKARWKADFYGKGTATIYATAEITNQGTNGFTFDDGTTSYDFTITYGQTTTVNKYLKPASRINETSKDNIVIEVRYYKDSARTQLIGTDTFNIQANWYIQNADYTWTSSTYTNEADIVYEKWDTAISNLGTGIRGKYDLLGDYGRVTFTLFDYMQYSSTYYYSGKTTNTILRTEGIYLQGTASYSTSISRFDAPAGKIVVYMFHHNGYSTDYAGYSPAGSSSFTTVLKVPTSNTSPYKVVLPVDDTPAGHKMYTANTFPVYTYLENIYVFNPLP